MLLGALLLFTGCEQALTATQVAAASGALTWMIVEVLHNGKATALGFASGILAGLVAVTPAAGVVQPLGATALGFFASILCYLAIILKNRLGYDDKIGRASCRERM